MTQDEHDQRYPKDTPNGHPRYYEIIEEIKDIHSRKNHDYAKDDDPLSNLKGSVRINIPPAVACWIRIQDKISRAEEYFKKGKFEVNESIHDTLNDLANYAILCRVLLEDAVAVEDLLDLPIVTM